MLAIFDEKRFPKEDTRGFNASICPKNENEEQSMTDVVRTVRMIRIVARIILIPWSLILLLLVLGLISGGLSEGQPVRFAVMVVFGGLGFLWLGSFVLTFVQRTEHYGGLGLLLCGILPPLGLSLNVISRERTTPVDSSEYLVMAVLSVPSLAGGLMFIACHWIGRQQDVGNG